MSDGLQHEEVLPPTQHEVLSDLGRFAASHGFYLAGGTAVALHLGHRRSVGFDWFIEDELSDPQRFAAILKSEGLDWSTGQTAAGTLHGSIRGVKVSCRCYRYPLIDALTDVTGYACKMASLRDLVSMKVAAAAQRGTKKDFVDIWALGRQGFTIGEMLGLYRRKYDTQDVAHVLMSLTYFDDAELEPMPTMLVDADWDRIKDELRASVRGFAGHA